MSSEAKNVGVELDRASDVRHLIANTPQARDERLSVGRPALLTGLLRWCPWTSSWQVDRDRWLEAAGGTGPSITAFDMPRRDQTDSTSLLRVS
jgi:hypothetical protein